MKRQPFTSLLATSVALCCLSLSGCATTQGPMVYQPVSVAVAVSCVPATLEPRPHVPTPAELAQIPDGPERYAKIASAYLALFARSLEAEPVLENCRTP